MCRTLNIIIEGFIGGGETSFARRRYARQVLNIQDLPKELDEGEPKTPETEIAFSEKGVTGIHPHDENPMVITVTYDEWEIIRGLVDQGSFMYILYWGAFERLHLDPDDVKPFKSSVVGFSGKRVQVKGYITLKTTFEVQEKAKEIMVR